MLKSMDLTSEISLSNPNSNGWVNPRRPLTERISLNGELAGGEDFPTQPRADGSRFRYGNLRRHSSLTAMNHGSDELGGGRSGHDWPIAHRLPPSPPKPTDFLHRHPPVAASSTDPYWNLRLLRPFGTAEEESDEEDADPGSGVAGGMEGESSDDSFPFHLLRHFNFAGETWEACVAKVNVEVDAEFDTSN